MISNNADSCWKILPWIEIATILILMPLKIASGWEARCDDRQTRLELIRSQGQSQEHGGGGTLGNQDGKTSLGSLPKEEFV